MRGAVSFPPNLSLSNLTLANTDNDLTPRPLQENVAIMAQFLPLDAFKKVYIVETCPSLVRFARAKVGHWGSVAGRTSPSLF